MCFSKKKKTWIFFGGGARNRPSRPASTPYCAAVRLSLSGGVCPNQILPTPLCAAKSRRAGRGTARLQHKIRDSGLHSRRDRV